MPTKPCGPQDFLAHLWWSHGAVEEFAKRVLVVDRLAHRARRQRNTFRMSVWEPPVRWEWVGGLPGVRIYYDHRFESSGPAATRLEWLVELDGPLAPLIRPVFARVYGRNLDRAIPRLQEWFRR